MDSAQEPNSGGHANNVQGALQQLDLLVEKAELYAQVKLIGSGTKDMTSPSRIKPEQPISSPTSHPFGDHRHRRTEKEEDEELLV